MIVNIYTDEKNSRITINRKWFEIITERTYTDLEWAYVMNALCNSFDTLIVQDSARYVRDMDWSRMDSYVKNFTEANMLPEFLKKDQTE